MGEWDEIERARDWEEISRQDEEARREHLEQTIADLKAVLGNEDGLERLEAITDEEWDRAQALDDEEEDEGEGEPPEPAGLALALNWHSLLEGFSRVMKLVHLAMRKDMIDEEQIRASLLKQGRKAFEHELTVQATRAGCPGRHGLLRNGPILSQLNDVYAQHAKSIVNTYNYDLAAQIKVIRRDVPRANRYTYAKRLRTWDKVRAELKDPVIGQMTEQVARSLAQEFFTQYNGSDGYARLVPRTAVCPVCQGWIDRDIVPLKVAMNHPPPYHVNCVPGDGWVTMADGSHKPIKEVQVGDSVLSRFGAAQVKQVFQRSTTEAVYRLSVADRVLRVTGDHPVLTDHGWLPARELQVGDKVVLIRSHEVGLDDNPHKR